MRNSKKNSKQNPLSRVFRFTSLMGVVVSIATVAPTQAGTLLIGNKGSLSVTIIDDLTLKPIKELKIGKTPEDTPHEVAVNPSGLLALVSHYGKVEFNLKKFEYGNFSHPGSAVSVIDVTSGQFVRRIELPPGCSPHGIQFISDSQALVTAEGIQSLLLIDLEARDPSPAFRAFPLPGKGAHLVTLNQRKDTAFISNKDSGSVVKFDLNQMKVTGEIKIGKHAEGITLNADDSELLVTNRVENTVSFIDSDTLRIKSRLSTQSGPIRIALFGYGKFAVLTNTLKGTAQIIDLEGKTIISSFKTTHKFNKKRGKVLESIFGILSVPITLLVSPDQKTAFIANSFAGNISQVDLKTGRIIQTILAGIEPDGMAHSPIAFKPETLSESDQYLFKMSQLLCARNLQGECADQNGYKLAHVREAHAIINAPISKVWAILMDLKNYKNWNSFMPVLSSKLNVGDPLTFEVHLGGCLSNRETVKILSRVEEKEFCWGSEPVGKLMKTQRCKHLFPLSDGSTLYYTTEKFKGSLGSSIMSSSIGKKIGNGIETEARELKAESESYVHYSKKIISEEGSGLDL